MLFSSTPFLPLELFVNAIIGNYLTSSYCITIFSETSLTLTIPISYITLTPNVNNLEEQILIVSEMGCSDYILNIRDPITFMTAFDRVVHQGSVRRSDRKIIILPFDNDNNFTTPYELFSMKETGYVANTLMVVENQSDPECTLFDIVTHKFVGPNTENQQPIFLDRWNSCKEGFENGVNLFPHDMTNLFGKPLKVACFMYKPYAFLDLDTAITPLGRDGLEMRLVDEMCRWINCSIEIVREDVYEWGMIYENETGGNGVLGAVLEDRADIGICALYSWYEEFRVMDFSSAVIRSGITCIAPAPRLLSSWAMPFMPFTVSSWVAVVIVFFYATFGLLVAKCSWSGHSFFTVFRIFIAQALSEKANKDEWRTRSITGWLVVAGLVIGCAYGAGLASTFTVPVYEHSIDTIKDLVDRALPWGATHEAWIFSITSSPDPLVKQLVSQFHVYPPEELKRRSFTRSMAFSVEQLPAGYFAIGEYITEEAARNMMIMAEDFYFEQTVAMLRKSSPYTEKVTQLVGRLHQSGLFLAWETQVALKYLNNKVQLEVRLSRSQADDSIRRPLCLGNVVGVFIIYSVGVTLSTLVFIIELLIRRQANILSKL